MENQEPEIKNHDSRDRWNIWIDVQHFVNTYGKMWWRFSEEKRARIADQLIKDIGEALTEGKEIKDLPKEIRIHRLKSNV